MKAERKFESVTLGFTTIPVQVLFKITFNYNYFQCSLNFVPTLLYYYT